MKEFWISVISQLCSKRTSGIISCLASSVCLYIYKFNIYHSSLHNLGFFPSKRRGMFSIHWWEIKKWISRCNNLISMQDWEKIQHFHVLILQFWSTIIKFLRDQFKLFFFWGKKNQQSVQELMTFLWEKNSTFWRLGLTCEGSVYTGF